MRMYAKKERVKHDKSAGCNTNQEYFGFILILGSRLVHTVNNSYRGLGVQIDICRAPAGALQISLGPLNITI